MVKSERNAIAEREKFVNAWNQTMVQIWTEKIRELDVVDTGRLLASPEALRLKAGADGRFTDLTFQHRFLEYGLWQDLGTGREVPIGNSGDIGREKKRERRRWFSAKYYSSIMRLRDFMGESLGNEFKAMFCNALDADRLRRSTDYYKKRGLS